MRGAAAAVREAAGAVREARAAVGRGSHGFGTTPPKKVPPPWDPIPLGATLLVVHALVNQKIERFRHFLGMFAGLLHVEFEGDSGPNIQWTPRTESSLRRTRRSEAPTNAEHVHLGSWK